MTRDKTTGTDHAASNGNGPAPATEAHQAAYTLPPIGGQPGTGHATTPGAFARPANVGGPYTFSSPDTPGMPAPSARTAWDFLPDDWQCEVLDTNAPLPPEDGQADVPGESCSPGCPCGETYAAYIFTDTRGIRRRVAPPIGFKPVTQLEHARLGIITPQMHRIAEREGHLSAAQVRDEVAAGRMVVPANKTHLDYQLDPMCIGRASTTKVNANMGASPVSSDTSEEIEKLRWAERWGADTVMDLSTGGDLDATREAIVQHAKVPIGTVPIYSMIIGRKLEDLSEQIILDTIEHQAKQGVDYFTVHAGVLYEHLPLAKDRQIGLVSRGGSLLAKWMLTTGRENPTNTAWEDICRIMRDHDVTFSIGDGCRPGGLADATDEIQLAELVEIGNLTERAWKQGVQVMVEGPGHVPFDQIEYNMKLQRSLCHGAPFYVLGPLTTDVFPGYDHITSAIGATSAAYHGAAMLCYVTPKEHLGLPKRSDVKEGCIAYRIAAHAGDVALGIPGSRDWDDELTKARAALNWEEHFRLSFDPDTARAYHDEDLDVDTDFCAMCGHDWCSVRISKDIQDWASGKDQQYKRDKPERSKALSQAQQRILEQRGYLNPDEIHKLAAKTKKKMGADQGKADCHSDYVDPNSAEQLQREVTESE
jgi:phosphomethylpyrimidine synthase